MMNKGEKPFKYKKEKRRRPNVEEAKAETNAEGGEEE
jgi:hypothetical protein